MSEKKFMRSWTDGIDKLLPLEGSYNVRDLGGHKAVDNTRVKYGMVFRGGELSKLTQKDLELLEQIPLLTLVDFRTEMERKKTQDKMPSTVKNIEFLPITPGNLDKLLSSPDGDGFAVMVEINRELVHKAQEQYKQFFALLADSKKVPLYFHCSAGKDRVGFGAALFLSALGVERESVYESFLLSAKYVKEKYRYIEEKYPHLIPVVTVHREYLEAAFGEIDKNYGGVENYLRKNLGVNIEEFRKTYTEKV